MKLKNVNEEKPLEFWDDGIEIWCNSGAQLRPTGVLLLWNIENEKK